MRSLDVQRLYLPELDPKCARSSFSGNATENFESPDMGANPVLQALAPGGFGEGEVAGPQHRHKQRTLPNGPTLRVVDRNRSPSKVDKELLPGLVLLTQHHVQALPP